MSDLSGFEFPCEVGAFDQDGDGNIDKQEATPKVFLYFDISECARFLMLCEQRFGKGQSILDSEQPCDFPGYTF